MKSAKSQFATIETQTQENNRAINISRYGSLTPVKPPYSKGLRGKLIKPKRYKRQ